MASIYKRKNSPNWWISYPNPKGGKKIQFSTKIPLKQKRRAIEYKKKIEAGLDLDRWGISSRTGIQEAMEGYLETVGVTRAARTLERYKECLNSFAIFWAGKYPRLKLLSDITVGRVQEWITYRSSIRAPGTIEVEYNVFVGFLNYSVRQGWLPSHPIKKKSIDRPKKRKLKHPRFFSKDEVEIIFEESLPARADLWKFLYYTAARIGEASKLEVSNIGPTYITFPAAITKARRTDKLPIAKNLQPVLKRLCEGKNKKDLLFSDAPDWGGRFNKLRDEFKKFLREHKIDYATLHTFRHTAASHWVQNEVPIIVVKELMRHKDIKDTMNYSHLAPSDVAKYVNRLWL